MIPTVPQTPVDAERLALIEHLARGVQAVAGNALAAMTGGSALRLCHDLPRPSFDLDLDVSIRRNWLRIVRRVADQSPWRSVVEVDQKQSGHGYIRITARPDGLPPWQTKVDVRVCDGTGHSLLVRDDCETVNGIVTRNIFDIAVRKREKLLGEDYRQQGRDLYDYAWLIGSEPRAVPVQDRLRFREWLLEWDSREDMLWRQALRQDRALNGVDPDAVIDAIYAIVERDPGLRFADAWTGTDRVALAARPLPNAAIRVGYSLGDNGNFVSLGTFANSARAVQFALDHELGRGEGIEHLRRKFAEAGVAERDMARLQSKADSLQTATSLPDGDRGHD